MTRRLFMLVVLLVFARPLHAGPEGGDDGGPSPSAGALERLEGALRRGVRAGSYEPLYRACVVESGDPDTALGWLDAIYAGDSKAEPDRQHAALWVAGHLRRRHGDLRTALGHFERLDGLRPSVIVSLERARLYDALGQGKQARETYEAVLPQLNDETLQVQVRLRMALLGVDGAEDIKESLVAFASEAGRDVAIRNRAAVVLALKGHPKEAAELFVAKGEGSARFRDEVRLADWALEADEAEAAQRHAWNAVQAAKLGRDRRYALTVLVEAHRKDDSLQSLIDRFAATDDLEEDAREVWIDLLRETGQVEKALALFRNTAGGVFTADMRREILEMCRESGREDLLVEAYGELIQAEPAIIEWREGLSRHYLQRGDREAALGVWRPYLEDEALRPYLLAAADSLQGLGLDDLAIRAAEQTIAEGNAKYAALLFLCRLHRSRGRFEDAQASLQRMDVSAPPDAPERMQLAEAYEQLGDKQRAVEVLEALREARGPAKAGEDLEMRLAWLHSEVGNDELAMERWLGLWTRVESVPRRRYVEDRLMTVASRLGKLADIAIELEEKLSQKTASQRDSGLLVRLYTKAGDPVSATEVIEEYMKHTGGDPVKALVEKGRVFLACTDYHNYEKTIHQLIDADPEGRGDYLRQLAMSQLERGKPDEARLVLSELAEVEGGSDSAEFEAGVLALAGMRAEAVAAYRRGMARHPDRIESVLLMADQMRAVGQTERAVGMFQHLAETADKDDLFTVAIDGLLNLEAPPAALRWARRITLERLAQRHDKVYLYQLIADLSEELTDRTVMLRALESALPIVGERRSAFLRELMDLARGGRGARGQRKRHLAYGRRLIGLNEVAPPQVYLDLGNAFLQAGEVTNATKTFALATDLPADGSFQRQVASSFEVAGYVKEALRTYESLLVSRSGDVSLLAKVGELQEQVGRDDVASELYSRAMDLMVARRPLSTVAKEEEDNRNDPFRYWYGNRNVDAFDQFYGRVLTGVLAAHTDERARALLDHHRDGALADLAAVERLRGEADEDKREGLDVLRAFPRLQSHAQLHRRVAIGFGLVDRADELDIRLLQAFPKDEALLAKWVRERMSWGLVTSARALIRESGRDEEAQRTVRFLTGGGDAEAPGLLPIAEATGLFLPLLAADENAKARDLLRRLDLSKVAKDDLDHVPVLLSAGLLLEDGSVALRLSRHWIKVLIKHDKSPSAYWRMGPVLKRIQVLLDDEQYRALCEYLVSLILEDPKSTGNWLNLIPDLQRSFERPLLDEEQLKELIEKLDGNRWYWIGSFFALVPAGERSSSLRTILPKVPPTRRMQFLLQLIEQIKDPIDGDFADFIVESFESAVEDLDSNDQFAYYGFTTLAQGKTNQALRLRLVRVPIEKQSKNLLVRTAYAVLLKENGEEEKAIEVGLDAYEELATAKPGPRSYYVSMARMNLQNAFLKEHRERFLALLDELEKAGGDTIEITNRRLEMLNRPGVDPEVMLAALRKAVEAHPKEDNFLRRLESQLWRMGRGPEALEVLEKVAELKPDDKNAQMRLVTGWQRLRHPVKALALKEKFAEDEEEKKPEETELEKVKRATIAEVKKALDAGNDEEARVLWRRLWRRFPVGEHRNMYFVSFPGQLRYTWPAPPKKGTPTTVRRARGGLDTFAEEDPEPTESRSAYEARAEHSFGEAEMRRQVRTWDGARLSNAGKILVGIGNAMVARMGREEAIRALLEDARRGKAGKLEYALLLSMLQESPEGAPKEALNALEDLTQTLNPTDVGQLRQLARVWSGLGQKENAARLYRWAGTRASAGNYFYFGASGTQPVSAYELVKEVGEVLENDLRDDTIESIFAFSDPGNDTRFGPSARDSYDTLVLSTWEDLLGADAALEKCRETCESVMDLEQGLRRQAAKIAATWYARAGEMDKALRCLEIALCELDAPEGSPPHFKSWYGNSGWLGHHDIRRLFPSDMEGWKDASGWLVNAADQIETWIEEERLDGERIFQARAIIALRLHGVGATDDAKVMIERLEKIAGDNAYHLLWIIDIARETGDEERARRIERRLLDEKRFNLERLAEAIAAIAKSEGPEAALKLGEGATEYTLHPQLLDELIRVAAAAGDDERVKHWQAKKAESQAAIEALKPKKEAP